MKKHLSASMAAAFFLFVFGHMAGSAAEKPFDVLVFSKTTMYRHESITNGVELIQKLSDSNNFRVVATEDSNRFTADDLRGFRVVVFLNTSGDILNSDQQNALKDYVENGGGLVGIHAAIAGAVATEGDWEWFANISCTTFTNHSNIVPATIKVERSDHISTSHLPARWDRKDEWYNFTTNPRGKATVLATLDESTYTGGTMGADHPIAWFRPVGKGRYWYTGLGHTPESYREPEFFKHILGGILFAARLP